MLGYLKGIWYGFYMIYFRLKGIKWWFVKKFQGDKEAEKYALKAGKAWCQFTVDIIGINITVKGKENLMDEPAVYIGNHTSILDIPILFVSADRMFGLIGKKEILKTPVIGYWMEKLNGIPLDRDDVRSAIKVIQEGCNKIKNGVSMGIFPEGTRSKDGTIGEFKGGSFKLATKTKSPIIPFAIDGAYRAFEIDRKFKPIDITITFLEPIYTKDLSKDDEKKLPMEVRSLIAKTLGQE